MRKLTAIVIAALFAKDSMAQEAFTDTTHNLQGIQTAIHSYFQFIDKGAGLYNGIEHAPYYFPRSEGIAYFKTEEWQKATIEYAGIVYEHVSAKFDLVKNEVIVRHPSGVGFILFSPRVANFTLGNDHFINLPDTKNDAIPAPGFYQQLRKGKISLIAKRSKVIEEVIEQREVKRNFVAINKYYLVKDGIYYSPRKEKDLITFLSEHKKEAKQILRKAKLRFRRTPEEALLTLVDYYNR